MTSEADRGPFFNISADALGDVTVDPSNSTPVVQRAEFTVNENGVLTPTSIAAMELYDGSQSSIEASIAAIDADFEAAESARSGEFLLTLVGLVDDPFAIA